MLSVKEMRFYGHASPEENYVQYLKNSGIYQVLEQAVAVLYELPMWPTNAVEFLAEYVDNGAVDLLQTLSLQAEFCFKKSEVEEVHRRISALDKKIDSLQLLENEDGTDCEVHDEECFEDLLCEEEAEISDIFFEASCQKTKHDEEDADEEEYEEYEIGSAAISVKRECLQAAAKTPSEVVNEAFADMKKFDPLGLVFPNVNALNPVKLFKGNTTDGPEEKSESILSIASSLAEYFNRRRLPETEEMTENDAVNAGGDLKIGACLDKEKLEWDTAYWDQFFNNGCFSLLDSEINVENETEAIEGIEVESNENQGIRKPSEVVNPGLLDSEISYAIDLAKVWRTASAKKEYTKDGKGNELLNHELVTPPHAKTAPPTAITNDDVDDARSFTSRKSTEEYPEKGSIGSGSTTSSVDRRLLNSSAPGFANVRSDKYKNRTSGASGSRRSNDKSNSKTSRRSKSGGGGAQETRSSGGTLGGRSGETDVGSSSGLSSNANYTGDGPKRMPRNIGRKGGEKKSSSQRSSSGKSKKGSSEHNSEPQKYFDPQSQLLHLLASDGMSVGSLMKMAKFHYGSGVVEKFQKVDAKIYDGI